MQHSVTRIGKEHEFLSNLRNEEVEFVLEDFISFASKNKSKYSLIECEGDFMVSYWHVDSLVNDYNASLMRNGNISY